MGHGIKIVSKDEKANRATVVGTLYLSHNWSDMKEWSVEANMHGKTVEETLESLRDADVKLVAQGVSVGVPHVENLNWHYGKKPCDPGTFDAEDLPEHERRSVFRYHLSAFVKTLEKLPSAARCYSDECHPSMPKDVVVDDDGSDWLTLTPAFPTFVGIKYVVSASKGPMTWVVDPIRGHMCVSSTEDALYVIGSLVVRGEHERAASWTKFVQWLESYRPVKTHTTVMSLSAKWLCDFFLFFFFLLSQAKATETE